MIKMTAIAGATAVAAGLLAATPVDADVAEPPSLTGSFTDAHLFSYVDTTGRRGDDDGVAIVARSHKEQDGLDTAIGWYMYEGTTSARVMWAASSSAAPSTLASCKHTLAVGSSVLYDGPPTRGLATWINPWIDFDFPDIRGGVSVAGPALTAVTSTPGRHVAVASIDCGPFGTARWSVPIVVLPRPDEQRPTGVSIDDGADFTNSKRVRLWLGWEGLADKVRISNDGGFAPSRTKEIQLDEGGVIDWTLVELAAERIPRQVYVKFHSVEQGWLRQTYSDDVILDTVEPRILRAAVVGGAPGSNLTAATRTLLVRAKDNKSGLAKAQVGRGAPRPKSRVVTFRKRLQAPAAGRVFVRVRDGAGNWSKWVRAQ